MPHSYRWSLWIYFQRQRLGNVALPLGLCHDSQAQKYQHELDGELMSQLTHRRITYLLLVPHTLPVCHFHIHFILVSQLILFLSESPADFLSLSRTRLAFSSLLHGLNSCQATLLTITLRSKHRRNC